MKVLGYFVVYDIFQFLLHIYFLNNSITFAIQGHWIPLINFVVNEIWTLINIVFPPWLVFLNYVNDMC
jgi:hypothetical protein